MKKKTATNNIVLEDKEMEVLMRTLIQKANKNGISMNQLNKSITTMWREEIQDDAKKEQQPLNKDEEIFSKKVKKFIEYYGNDIVELYNIILKSRSYEFIIKEDDLERKRDFLDNYYKILCSIYAVFRREGRVNQNKIISFLRRHFDYSFNIIGEEINLLYYFFYENLDFSDDTKLPQHHPEGYVDCEHRLLANKEFCDFVSRYDLCNFRVNQVTLATVWLIEKYF